MRISRSSGVRIPANRPVAMSTTMPSRKPGIGPVTANEPASMQPTPEDKAKGTRTVLLYMRGAPALSVGGAATAVGAQGPFLTVGHSRVRNQANSVRFRITRDTDRTNE